MTHHIRDMETHLKNTWQWDAWGFTEDWANKCTMSDIDGFVPFFAERGSQFLIVEMKHWDGKDARKRIINRDSGQFLALKRLSQQPNFTVIVGFGDTATREVYYYEVWNDEGQFTMDISFKQYLNFWFRKSSHIANLPPDKKSSLVK